MTDCIFKIINNKFVYVPFWVWLIIQISKVIQDFFTNKKFNAKRILGAGGIVSSHTATVVTLAVMVGKEIGFDTPTFAIAMIFACVVMYDAMGIRNQAGKQAAAINKILKDKSLNESDEDEEDLNENLGHKPIQVLMGLIVGLIVGSLA